MALATLHTMSIEIRARLYKKFMVVCTSKTALSQHPPASHLYAGTLYLSNVTEYLSYKRERER